MTSQMPPSTSDFSNKELFEYWHGRVEFKNEALIADPKHVNTQTLRHDCTNYDELWRSPTVLNLPQLEQDRMVAVIKYACTSRVLQRRAVLLRKHIGEIENSLSDLETKHTGLAKLLYKFKQALFGKEQEIKGLQNKISALKTENEALKADAESSKAYAELLEEFDKLQKEFDKVSKRRKELAKNNQSLGGRVAHTKRFRRERDEARQERDEAREILAAHKEQIEQLQQLNKTLTTENEQMKMQLSRLQPAKG